MYIAVGVVVRAKIPVEVAATVGVPEPPRIVVPVNAKLLIVLEPAEPVWIIALAITAPAPPAPTNAFHSVSATVPVLDLPN